MMAGGGSSDALGIVDVDGYSYYVVDTTYRCVFSKTRGSIIHFSYNARKSMRFEFWCGEQGYSEDS